MAESKKAGAFTEEERDAMKERAKETRRASKAADGEQDLLAQDRRDGARPTARMAERIHAIVTETAPELAPKTWYGQPAYAKDGKVVVFFQAASKFKTRYATLGFSEDANLDDGTMWPTSFAVVSLTAADEKRITELVKKAVG